MMTVTGIFVQILRFWPCLLAFSLAILNFAASQAKIKQSQTRKKYTWWNLHHTSQEKREACLESFKNVCDNFLGKYRSEDYVQVVNDLLSHYHGMACNMSQKAHVLQSNLDFLWKILVMWMMTLTRDSFRIFQWWSKDSKENGTLACWQTTAGV